METLTELLDDELLESGSVELLELICVELDDELVVEILSLEEIELLALELEGGVFADWLLLELGGGFADAGRLEGWLLVSGGTDTTGADVVLESLLSIVALDASDCELEDSVDDVLKVGGTNTTPP